MPQKFYLFLFPLFFLTEALHSQSILGVITNLETGDKIPYVNIGYQNRPIGTVSSENGEFQLNYSHSEISDTIIFSAIGYHTVTYPVRDLKNHLTHNNQVFMNPKTSILKEIVVASKELSHSKKIGNGLGSKRKKVGFGPNDNLGREIGTIMKLQNKNAYIHKVLVNIGVNDYGKIKVRLNLYKWSNGRVGERLNDFPLYFETELSEGIWEMNVEKYDIEVTSDFFVSIEYIENMGAYGLYFTFSFNKQPTFTRETNNSLWEETKYENKRVSISINTVISY